MKRKYDSFDDVDTLSNGRPVFAEGKLSVGFAWSRLEKFSGSQGEMSSTRADPSIPLRTRSGHTGVLGERLLAHDEEP
jgi:hypothetical protein